MSSRGFTLLEMTVVLLLVGLMSTLLIQGLRFGGRAYTQVIKVDEANWNVVVAQRFLRSALQCAYPFDPERANRKAFGLEGTATRLAFSAAIARSAAPGALYRYEISVVQHNLLVRWRPDRDGRAGAEREETLLENIERIELSYAPAAGGAWQDNWLQQRDLPTLVRLRVIFAKDDPRRWSDLIVGPRVTDDAMAWLDHL
jgi:general secretion pathway protein J